jgi:hypothetical protein
MNTKCPICRRPLPANSIGCSTIAIGSRPLVRVHDGDCKAAALSGVRVIGKGLLFGARKLLHRKFPLASALIEDYAAYRRKQRGKERLHG